MSETRDRATRHLWNPMTRMADILGRQRVFVRGEGSRIFDEDGKEYIDAQGSLWYVNVGYGRAEIVEAVATQMHDLPAYGLFGDVVTPPAAALAERVASLAHPTLNRTFFTSGGSEAVETAIKIARQYFRLLGHAEKAKIISRWGAYHGVTMGALSATGTIRNRRRFEPLVPGFVHIEALSAQALERAIALEGPETVAAFIAEPIMGATGAVPPPEDYFARIREICDEYEILLISDDVICSFGRLGHWFGLDHWGVRPDLITTAKGITSGYLPLGAVLVSDAVSEPFYAESDPENGFFHGNTYSGHAAACAAGLANIDIIQRERLLERSAASGRYLHEGLEAIRDDSDFVSEIRGGIGLMAALEIGLPPETQVSKTVARFAYERGVLVRPMTGNSVTLSPPLIIEDAEIDRVCEVLAEAVALTQKSLTEGVAARV